MNAQRRSLVPAAPRVLNAFRDLSTRTQIYRSRLMEEFSLAEGESKGAPLYSSNEIEDGKKGNQQPGLILSDKDLMKKILKEQPHQLIKFKLIKRSRDDFLKRQLDRRILRVSSKNNLPFGVWAKWITNRKSLSLCILIIVSLEL